MSVEMNRRLFVKATALSAAAMPAFRVLGQTPAEAKIENQINVAVIGFGAEGEILVTSMMPIPGIQIKAVCDVWESRRRMARLRLKPKYGEVKVFEDYKEMLSEMKGKIDAVVIATPDWMHHTHTIACLEAGLDVYCEKEMSNSLENAKQMVLASQRTGKLLQIGHQRRSNPRYRHAIDNVIRKANMLGRVTHAYGQWNRSVAPFITLRGGAKSPLNVPVDTLEKYGYENMEQFLNWRWFSKYGGGPMVDLGSHQIDLFFWVWDAIPLSVSAIGGNNYYKREMNDNVMAMYEFKCKDGFIGRAYYQVLTTSSRGGFYEQFMGENGSLTLSEVSARGNTVQREVREGVPPWDVFMKEGLILPLKQTVASRVATKDVTVDARVTAEAEGFPLPIEMKKLAHQPHLENFFEAVRRQDKSILTCPSELAYESAVAVLAANKAVAQRTPITFKSEDFHI